MATYAIGDVQGCFDELMELLAVINFNADNDTLWFTGDLINRGPKSLEVLRFVKGLGRKQVSVLGNHDLHFLAVAFGKIPQRSEDTFRAILHAPDRYELIEWLRTLPLLHYENNFVMTHAGIAPLWSLTKAQQLAHELAQVLQSHALNLLLQHIYGDYPNHWNDNLQGPERWRCIINYFTRMRFCDAQGRLALNDKGHIYDTAETIFPWFSVPTRIPIPATIIFGHWSALLGKTGLPDIQALDTGCVWGNYLSALRLDDGVRFTTPSHLPQQF